MNVNRPESGSSRHDDTRAAGSPGVDLVDILAWFWSHRVAIVSITVVCTLGMVVYSFLQPTVYTAQVTMLPQNNNDDSGLLSRVASFTGFSLGTETSFEQLYGRIVTSERILGASIDRTWQHRDFGDEASLYEVLGVGKAAPDGSFGPVARTALIGKLREEVVSFFRDDRSGYMALRVTAPGDPAFAADLANFLAQQLDAFNRAFRSRQAEEQEVFVTERLAEAQLGLRTAADKLAAFMESNRSYRSSPSLLQRYEELEREVQAESSVWIELRRQRELAGIERNKNMVSITILDEATPPIRKSGPRHSLAGLAGIVVGFVLSLLWLCGRSLVREMADRDRVAG